MKHEELTGKIIGAAMAVLNELKPGLDEKLYENALVIELAARGHTVEQQREYPVHYRGHFIGKLVPDLIVDGKVIADPKVVSAFNETHTAQMLGYLNITGLEVALLLNFKESQLEVEACRVRRTRVSAGKEPRISRRGQPQPKKLNHGFHGWHGYKKDGFPIREIREIRGKKSSRK